MASGTRHGFPSLMGLFLLFLSLFNIVNSSPLPETKVDLVAREPKLITQDRYEAFLKKHYPTTDKYAFYTANSYNQLKAFIDANAGYESYKTMIEGPHWYDDFNEADDEDDAEAASAAMATLASGDVLVFGAVEWKKKGGSSIWTSHEVPNLKAGLGDRVKSINHMIKDATDPSSVLATDDGDGNMTWKPGHSEGETNATPCPSSSSRRSLSRRDPRDDCDAAPQPEEPPPGPPKDPKSLQIISVLVLCEHPACDSYSWKFMEGDPGTGVDTCGKGVRDDVEVLGDALDDKFPSGEWDMRFDGYSADCRYQGLGATGPGGDVGWLHCPDREAIKCIESPEYKGGDGDRNDCGAIPVAYCDWE